LVINEYNSKEEAARQKILQYHFFHGHDNIHVFSDMEYKVLPRAIAWIGADDMGFLLLYQLVRDMPSLFESNAGTELIKKKRKIRC